MSSYCVSGMVFNVPWALFHIIHKVIPWSSVIVRVQLRMTEIALPSFRRKGIEEELSEQHHKTYQSKKPLLPYAGSWEIWELLSTWMVSEFHTLYLSSVWLISSSITCFRVSCIAGRFFAIWVIREALGHPHCCEWQDFIFDGWIIFHCVCVCVCEREREREKEREREILIQ